MKRVVFSIGIIFTAASFAAPSVSYQTATNIAEGVVSNYDTTNLTARINAKQDKLTAGANITITADNVISATGGGGGTGNYNDLSNKPKVNDVELTGNKTLDDLGIQPKGDYLTSHQSLNPATNYVNRVSTSATNYTDTCCRTLANSATNYTDTKTSDMATKTWVVQQGYETSEHASDTYQPKGNYLTAERDPTVGLTNNTVYASGTNRTFLTEHQSLTDYATKEYANRVAVAATNYANTAASGAVVAATNAAAADAAGKYFPKSHPIAGQSDLEMYWDDENEAAHYNCRLYGDSYFSAKGGFITPDVNDFSGYINDSGTLQDALDAKADTYSLAAVATSGSYNDLSDKPTIPAAQIQSDWTQTNTSAKDYIKNKPTIPAAITEYLKSATATATSLTVTKQDDNTVGLEVQYDYALTNLTGVAVNLASGQIGNIAMAANVSVTLDFSAAANRSGDCLLYVANTDGAADHYIVPMQTNDYTFVSADLAKALTMTKATTNLVSFTRLTPTAVLVSKLEVK